MSRHPAVSAARPSPVWPRLPVGGVIGVDARAAMVYSWRDIAGGAVVRCGFDAEAEFGITAGGLCVSGWASSRLSVAIAGAAVAVGLAVAGCSSTIEGRAQPVLETGTVDAVDVTGTPGSGEASRTTTASAPTTTPPEAGDVGFDAEIGDCVTLGGTTTDASIEAASCGSNESNYKVIGKAEQSSQCVG